MPLITNGFFSGVELAEHFKKHGAKVRAPDALSYQALADQFMGGPKSTTCVEKQRTNGDKVRYDHATEEFGILTIGNVIKTYFKADPAIHGCTSNLVYFNRECSK